MSRITLNLKKAGVELGSDDLYPPKTFLFDRKRRRRSSSAYFPERHSLIISLPSVPHPAAGRLERPIEITFAPVFPPTPSSSNTRDPLATQKQSTRLKPC